MATSVGGCRQTLKLDPVGAIPGAHSSLQARSASAASLDTSARQLRTALLLLSLPLASAARAFTECRGWKELGYARLSDHARERLGRSAHWVSDYADLSRAMEALPGLASALTGEDGGHPVGLVAARHIGKVASRESLASWLSIARTESVRMLKARVRSAVKVGSAWPEAEADSSDTALPAEGDSHQRICLFVPAAVREAFAEALELYRTVKGHSAPAGDFVESLIAEACSGPLAGRLTLETSIDEGGHAQKYETATPETRVDNATFRMRQDETESDKSGQDHEKKTADLRWATIAAKTPTPGTPDGAAEQEAAHRAHARLWLQEILGHGLKITSAIAADTRMRRLLALHDELERQLAEVVTQMADTSAWRALGYAGFADYARRGLGWSRGTLSNRVQLVRRLRRLPVVQQAYQQGRIGRLAACVIARAMTKEGFSGTPPRPIPDATQKAWVERAAAATIKRLQDETRAVARLMVVGHDGREPLDDITWHASLHRQAGTAQRRVQALTQMAMAAPGPLLSLSLTLRRESAADLLRVLAVTRQDTGLAQTFSITGGSVPVWVALLALLQDFLETWDVDVGGRRPSSQRIYIRDGWRCVAPGCSSRKNLEVHHVVYRSQGGGDRAENLACLCRFHHQMGEHGLLAQVRGEAPLGLTWRLGRDGCGGTYRNELRQAK